MKIIKKKEIHILIIKYKDGRIEISKTLNTVSKWDEVLQQLKLILNFLKQWKVIFRISFNCKKKELTTVSHEKAKNLTGARKSHHHIEILS